MKTASDVALAGLEHAVTDRVERGDVPVPPYPAVALKVQEAMGRKDFGLGEVARLVEECRRCPEDRIVITHGTDTMVETARALLAAGLGKTVVLTGAMVPYAFGSSDGLFNLGSALSFAQVLPPGVYVAMNGRVFPGDRVRKDRERGVFEDAP